MLPYCLLEPAQPVVQGARSSHLPRCPSPALRLAAPRAGRSPRNRSRPLAVPAGRNGQAAADLPTHSQTRKQWSACASRNPWAGQRCRSRASPGAPPASATGSP
eukprot:11465755-Alexandrium_andersonii.AAC.1